MPLGKSRTCLLTAGILEVLYGLTFVCMGVACQYLAAAAGTGTENGVNSQVFGGGAGAASSSHLSNMPHWQINELLADQSPHTVQDRQPVRRDNSFVTASTTRKDAAEPGIWLAILYTLTGFLAIIVGQERDRIIPLLHTVLALICIAWAPLMFELLYLLIRPSSIYAYSFLYEMDLITSQKHWAAYIVSICIVVAGSALYLFSAALAAYQYGVRIIERSSSLPASGSGLVLNASATSTSATGNKASLRSAAHSQSQKPEEPKQVTTAPANPTSSAPTATPAPDDRPQSKPKPKPLHQLTLPLNTTTDTLRPASTDQPPSRDRTGTEAKFIKHSRTDLPITGNTYEQDNGPQHTTSTSMTLPHSHGKNPSDGRQYHTLNRDDRGQRSAYDYNRNDYREQRDYSSRSFRDSGREREHAGQWRRDKGHEYSNSLRNNRGGGGKDVYDFGPYYDDSQEAVV
ncbi:uncharacterized protein LOC129594185 [Paramacrobiotus metropolitanus]|uniref:uncharacterized protein LOC129594185 n=1 Tax=Paramacrobiotus metropolitanus TaxID=2943436 RepID=UPI0024457E39|nr:uncharacterized protein LOC129594185 [Paramacrobiotus metropolitanus]XP_055346765.1 uncharacterized protein LOC129594185 [Paramacrobiotus metropolitanus]